MGSETVRNRSVNGVSRKTKNGIFNTFVFVFSGLAALWLAWLVLSETTSVGWFLVPFFILFWLVLAYLVLPRLHSIMTRIYVPNYFIGRARTSDGLLGDPINLAAQGSELELHTAMTRAGWIKADEINFASSRKMVTSTLLRRSYDEAPVSPLLLFGRQQDIAYQQEVEGNPAKRHHVRFWRSPRGWLLPGGRKVSWLAAGTFDKSVGFSLFTLQVTHKIDQRTDIERDHIVSSLTEHNPDITVDVIEDFSTGYHSRNGGGDTIETDGDLPILDLRHVPTGGVELKNTWESRVEQQASRRPLATYLGVALMCLRVVVGSVTIAAILFEHKAILAAILAELAGDEAPIAEWTFNIILAVAALGVLFYLLLAWLIFRGSNVARILAMVASMGLICLYAADIFNGQTVTLRQNYFGLPLDILVLLALSSEAATRWARRHDHDSGADIADHSR